ncbi:MAG: cyclase family protein [Burkholderiales bacterium]
MIKLHPAAPLALACCLAFAAPAQSVEPAALIAKSKKETPAPPWPAGDERGMANTLGAGTMARCAWHMARPKAKVYELSYIRSGTMPLSGFSGPYVTKPKASAGIPGTSQAFNMESLAEGAEPGQQGTQIDALGHFGFLPQPWDGKAAFPAEGARYYGGYTQKDVKPTPDSPLLRLGIEKIQPLITSAVVLDAKALVGGGQPMKAGETVTAKHIEAMLKAQGLAKRGILPGDVVYVRTGWGDHWKDPDTEKKYYASAPGLAYDAAKYLGDRRIVAIGLDTPFIDPVPDGMLAGKAGPAAGVPDGVPFALHHHMLTQTGIHHIENAKLDEIANDKVWTACTMILPQREKGSAGAAVRPVAVGVPGK